MFTAALFLFPVKGRFSGGWAFVGTRIGRTTGLALTARRTAPALAGTRRTFWYEIINHIAVAVGNDQTIANLGKNSRQLFLIHHGADRQRLSLASGTTRTPDTVDIGINSFRKIEIDHQSQAGHIDTARCHIGGNKHLQGARLEFADDFLTNILAHVTVQRINTYALFAQPFGQFVSPHARAHKDQHLPVLDRLQLAHQQITLVDIVGQQCTLADGIDSLPSILDLHRHRVAQKPFSKLSHLFGHSG